MSGNTEKVNWFMNLQDKNSKGNLFLPKLIITWLVLCSLFFCLGWFFYYIKGLPSQVVLTSVSPEQVKSFVAFKRIGELIMQAAVTAMVAGGLATLTAYAAFHNMDRNERKKIAREEYQSYTILLNTLQNWKNQLLGIDGYFSGIRKQTNFDRGLAIPYILYNDNHTNLDLDSLTFLSRFVRVGDDNKCVDGDYCLNTLHLAQMEVAFENVLLLVQRRNALHEAKFLEQFNKFYIGGGASCFDTNVLKESIHFAEFSNFLYLSEQIIESSGSLIIEIDELVKDLNNSRKRILDNDVVMEKGGRTQILAPEFNKDDYVYTPLTDAQESKLYASDYPSCKSVYTDRNEVLHHGSFDKFALSQTKVALKCRIFGVFQNKK